MNKYQDKKCFVYARANGGLKEAEEKINNQVSILKAYANKFKLKIVKIFKDTNLSSSSKPNHFDEMVKELKNNPVEVILVTDLDRITRTFTNILKLEPYFSSGKLAIITPNNILDSNNRFQFDCTVYLARAYRNHLSEAVKEGLRRKKERETEAKVTV